MGLAHWYAGLLIASRSSVVPAAAVEPLSLLDPAEIFTPVQREGAAAPGERFSNASKPPLPTNAWWQNTVLPPSNGTSGNVFQMPYFLLLDEAGVKVMQPFEKELPAQQFFDENFAMTVGFGENESDSISGPSASYWDEMTLGMSWWLGGQEAMHLAIVRGSPYITAEFHEVIPQVSAKQALRPGGFKVDGHTHACDREPVAGSYFTFELYHSDMTWLFFVPRGSNWTCSAGEWSVNLTATKPIRSAVRLALVNGCATGSGPYTDYHCRTQSKEYQEDTYSELLIEHAGCYPRNSSISYEVADTAEVTWSWGKHCLPGWEAASLLQLAWPVHLPLLGSAPLGIVTPFKDLCGEALPIIGDSWKLRYSLIPDTGLKPFRPIKEEFRAELLEVLRGPKSARWNGDLPDKDFDLPRNMKLGAGDTYWSGKFLARLARIIVIADELGQSHEPYFEDMVERLLERTSTWLDPNSSANPFLYDKSWGGLVACGCDYNDCNGTCKPVCKNPTSPPSKCPALHDPEHNFGNAWYNDHHFQYGYFVYAAAVASHFRPQWGQQWREHILALVRDYANPSAADPHYPVTRHKDWFLGSSWASGITKAWPRGRNQESASEAIASYYAIYAYGCALNLTDPSLGKQLMDLGRLLTAMETHAVEMYYHVRPNQSMYLNYSYKIVGVLWQNQAQHWTWFGDNDFVISGIQLIPVIPALEPFLKPDWVHYHLPGYMHSCQRDPNCTAMGWSWPVCTELAVINAENARTCLQQQPSDVFAISRPASNGQSYVNALHWIATRPSEAFAATQTSPPSFSTIAACNPLLLLSVFFLMSKPM